MSSRLNGYSYGHSLPIRLRRDITENNGGAAFDGFAAFVYGRVYLASSIFADWRVIYLSEEFVLFSLFYWCVVCSVELIFGLKFYLSVVTAELRVGFRFCMLGRSLTNLCCNLMIGKSWSYCLILMTWRYFYFCCIFIFVTEGEFIFVCVYVWCIIYRRASSIVVL